jgi:hypothetical protein
MGDLGVPRLRTAPIPVASTSETVRRDTKSTLKFAGIYIHLSGRILKVVGACSACTRPAIATLQW